jgi:hypothetical protein
MPSAARVPAAVISAISTAAVLIAAIAAVAAVSVAAVAFLYLPAVAAALFDLRCERRLVAAAAAERKVNEPRFLAVILFILLSVGVVGLALLKTKAAIITKWPPLSRVSTLLWRPTYCIVK